MNTDTDTEICPTCNGLGDTASGGTCRTCWGHGEMLTEEARARAYERAIDEAEARRDEEEGR